MAFRWTLQKLLDVTVTRETAAKAAMFEVSRRIAALHGEIVRRKEMACSLLQGLGQMTIEDRLARQQMLMDALAAEREHIRTMMLQLAELREQRELCKAELVKIIAKKDTLERLREEAYEKYQRLIGLKEQQQADESFNVRFARNMQVSLKLKTA